MNQDKRAVLDELPQDLLSFIEKFNSDPSILETVPGDYVEGLYTSAYSFYKVSKYSEAETLFRLLTALKMNESRHWKGLGAALQMQKYYKAAYEAYYVACVKDPLKKDPTAPFHMAQCLYSLGKIKEAIVALKEAKAMVKRNREHQDLRIQIDLLLTTWSNQLTKQKENRKK